jgi:3-methylcrotonyl-CoA carboxylase alpha subunit
VAGDTIVLRDQWGAEHRAIVEANGEVRIGDAVVRIHVASDGSVRVAGTSHTQAWAITSQDRRWVFIDGEIYTFEVEQPALRRRRSGAHPGSLTAPMPATVRKIAVASGDTVHRGDVLIVLEAMKMELPVRAPSDGVVQNVNCREGDMVQAGQTLAEITS